MIKKFWVDEDIWLVVIGKLSTSDIPTQGTKDLQKR